jgi:hypothetical protein
VCPTHRSSLLRGNSCAKAWSTQRMADPHIISMSYHGQPMGNGNCCPAHPCLIQRLLHHLFGAGIQRPPCMMMAHYYSVVDMLFLQSTSSNKKTFYFLASMRALCVLFAKRLRLESSITYGFVRSTSESLSVLKPLVIQAAFISLPYLKRYVLGPWQDGIKNVSFPIFGFSTARWHQAGC